MPEYRPLSAYTREVIFGKIISFRQVFKRGKWITLKADFTTPSPDTQVEQFNDAEHAYMTGIGARK